MPDQLPDPPVRSASSSHLSIGEVLGLLLEEFPDVTISKIRFLESQGLIDPERTPSGYRKFYDEDVELLRCILREQRENYLPLRVIKDRLDSGEIDPTNETPRPRGIKNMPDDWTSDLEAGGSDPSDGAKQPSDRSADRPSGVDTLFQKTDTAPTTPAAPAQASADSETIPPTAPSAPSSATTSLLTGVVLTRTELCSMASITDEDLASLESYGVVSTAPGTGGMYGEDALEIAAISRRFLDVGFDARHLRGWKVAADREAGLFEQMIQPLLRQRNPHAREQARRQLAEMESIGGQLRSALMRSAMRHHDHD